MRQFVPTVAGALAVLLIAASAFAPGVRAQTGAVGLEESRARMLCGYEHPTHPKWNFFQPCEVVSEARPGKETVKASVDNGSAFSIETVVLADTGTRLTLNGKAAEKVGREGATACYRTSKERDIVCLYPDGSGVPEAMALAEVGDGSEAAQGSGFGGGLPMGGAQAGFCRLTLRGATGEGLIETGACKRAESCQVEAGSGARSCLMLHVWGSGRETGVYTSADWLALDGVEVVAAGTDCVAEAGGGLAFCFAESAFDVAGMATVDEADLGDALLGAAVTGGAEIPAVIGESGGATGTSAGTEAASEAEATAAAGDAAGAGASARPLPEGYEIVDRGLCTVTKNGRPFVESACVAANLCEDDACDMLFRLGSGAEINLMVVSGEVIDMDGADTGRAPLVTEGPFCLPYVGSPFLFCFAPEAG